MPFDAAPLAAAASAQTTRAATDCALCPVQACLGRNCDSSGINAWAGMLGPKAAVMPGAATLFAAGEKMRAVYSVRGGCIKTYTVDAEGNERIRGFYFPGDLIGLDAFGGARTLSSAAAVVPSQVCVAPLANLRELLAKQPAMAQQLTEQTSRELALALALSGDFSAEQRLAAFLLHMEERLQSVGGALRLPMTRRDIGNYLRLATETVCRTLKTFERKGWLRCEEKCIRLVARHKLYEVGEIVGICKRPMVQMALAA